MVRHPHINQHEDCVQLVRRHFRHQPFEHADRAARSVLGGECQPHEGFVPILGHAEPVAKAKTKAGLSGVVSAVGGHLIVFDGCFEVLFDELAC